MTGAHATETVPNLPETVEVLLRLHDDERATIRYFAEQRATLGNVLVGIDAGLLGVLSFAASEAGAAALRPLVLAVGIVLAASGAFGAFSAWKYDERGNYHQRRSLYYRDRLEELLPATEVRWLSHLAGAEHSASYAKGKDEERAKGRGNGKGKAAGEPPARFHTFKLAETRGKPVPRVRKSFIERSGFGLLWAWLHLGVLGAGLALCAWTVISWAMA